MSRDSKGSLTPILERDEASTPDLKQKDNIPLLGLKTGEKKEFKKRKPSKAALLVKQTLSSFRKECRTLEAQVALISRLCAIALYHDQIFHDTRSLPVISNQLYSLFQKIIAAKTELMGKKEYTHLLDILKSESEQLLKIVTFLQNEPMQKVLDCYEFDSKRTKLLPKESVVPDDEKEKNNKNFDASLVRVYSFLEYCTSRHLFSHNYFHFDNLFFVPTFLEFKQGFDKKLKELQAKKSLEEQVATIERFFEAFQTLYQIGFFHKPTHSKNLEYLNYQRGYIFSLRDLYLSRSHLVLSTEFDGLMQALIHSDFTVFQANFKKIKEHREPKYMDSLLWKAFDFSIFKRKLLNIDIAIISTSTVNENSENSSSTSPNSTSKQSRYSSPKSGTLSSVAPSFPEKLINLNNQRRNIVEITYFIQCTISGRHDLPSFQGSNLFKAIFKTNDSELFEKFFNVAYGKLKFDAYDISLMASLNTVYDYVLARYQSLEKILNGIPDVPLKQNDRKDPLYKYKQCLQMLILIGRKTAILYNQMRAMNISHQRAATMPSERELKKHDSRSSRSSMTPSKSPEPLVQKEYKKLLTKIKKQFITLKEELSEKIKSEKLEIAKNTAITTTSSDSYAKKNAKEENATLKKELINHQKLLKQYEAILKRVDTTPPMSARRLFQDIFAPIKTGTQPAPPTNDSTKPLLKTI